MAYAGDAVTPGRMEVRSIYELLLFDIAFARWSRWRARSAMVTGHRGDAVEHLAQARAAFQRAEVGFASLSALVAESTGADLADVHRHLGNAAEAIEEGRRYTRDFHPEELHANRRR